METFAAPKARRLRTAINNIIDPPINKLQKYTLYELPLLRKLLNTVVKISVSAKGKANSENALSKTGLKPSYKTGFRFLNS